MKRNNKLKREREGWKGEMRHISGRKRREWSKKLYEA